MKNLINRNVAAAAAMTTCLIGAVAVRADDEDRIQQPNRYLVQRFLNINMLGLISHLGEMW
jgi:hypothetical protein